MSAYLEITASELNRQYGTPRDAPRLASLLADAHLQARHEWADQDQIMAWTNSLPELARELMAAGLPDLTMFIEFRMPPSAMRADVILAGPGRESGRPVYTLVELKQWSSIGVRGDLVIVGQTDHDDHPAQQIQEHMDFLEDVYTVLDRRPFEGIAFLHNAAPHDMKSLRRLYVDRNPLLFGRDERGDLRVHLLDRYRPGSSTEAAELLADCHAVPTAKFMGRVADLVRGDDRFVLLGEQARAYRAVIKAVEEADRSEKRTAVIVRGHACTGKTAIALSVLAKYFGTDRPAQYLAWQQAFRKGLERNSKLKVKDRIKVFMSPRTIDIKQRARRFGLRVAICDEAHRLEEHTHLRRGPRHKATQLEEILSLSRVTLFLLDEHQAVKATEIGTADTIAEKVREHGVEVKSVSLTEQFRSGGNASYVERVLGLLDFGEGNSGVLSPTEDFEAVWVERPDEIAQVLSEKTGDAASARITAGFCWPWPDDNSGRVEIGSWSMPWNYKRRKDGKPSSMVWAWEEGGESQVGCVHTAQGFEWPWTAVILGPDIVYEDDKIRIVPERNDQYPRSLKRKGAVFTPEELIRNAYYVLLTRGIRGVVIYAYDNKLRNFLSTKMPRAAISDSTMSAEEWSTEPIRTDIRSAVDVAHAAGVPLPAARIEYAPEHQALLAWREQRIAVLPSDLDSKEAERATRAYEESGWIARMESEWDGEELKSALLDDQ
ncbi:DUF2075 domain-containing protein [Glycomyces albus]